MNLKMKKHLRPKYLLLFIVSLCVFPIYAQPVTINFPEAELTETYLEQQLADSILHLSVEELIADDYSYEIIHSTTISSDGKTHPSKLRVKKIKREKSVIKYKYMSNKLKNTSLTFLLMFLYVIGIATLIKYKQGSSIERMINGGWGIFIFIAIVSWFLFDSIIFNTNELITRNTGKQYEATVSCRAISKLVLGTRGSYSKFAGYHLTFTCVPADSVSWVIDSPCTTFDPDDYSDTEIEHLIVCLDEKREMAAVLLPNYTWSNIIWITVWSVMLILGLFVFYWILTNWLEIWDNI
jgi:hypothetical protein